MERWIDSHAHVTSVQCVEQADILVEEASRMGVDTIINICTDPASLEAGLKLAERCSGVYNVGATTPHDVEQEGEKAFGIFAEQARAGRLVAVGETGLDYFYKHSPVDLQQHYLRRYVQLAKECQLPLVFHCREAFADLFRLTDEEGGCRAVLHCFTGNEEEAREVVARGWYVSLSGIVTYKKSEELRAVARQVPIEHLLIETDTPYLAPQSRRGQPNQPAYLVETAHVVAALKQVSIADLAACLRANASALFGRQF